MTSRIVVSLIAGAALLALTLVPGQASSAAQMNRLTFNAPVALPKVTLVPGTYVFERALEGTINLVRVTNATSRRVVYLGFTEIVPRPRSLQPGQVVSLGEAPPGLATPINVWFPIGASDGHRFIY